MNTTRSNSYVLSRDFPDNKTRMRALEIIERLHIEPGMAARIVVVFGLELAPGEPPVTQDNEVWITELATYSILNVLKREDPRDWFRKEATEVLVQSIAAFVDSRREPPQKPKLEGGNETYECQTPGTDEMFRPHHEGGYELTEVGAIVTMIEALNAGDIPLSPTEALHNMVEMFDQEYAKRQRVTAWSPLGGNGPSHRA